MYYLMIWDKELAFVGQDGCIDRLEISLEIARALFSLDPKEFPIASSLSFDDYDIFSDSQIDLLVDELLAVARVNPFVLETVELMVGLMLRAKKMKKAILFDPFRC